ncbi:DUF5337 family protein [Pseudoprimorskyibacter insulae]|uniref:DUF5337 domain-containing protein n=1 Tax=Pseudoprimorskyibacter insulae TaxID=1695997 RepID=A0A2R8AXF0_9RHOB|nr:DUF5337 family protein [Pseudoprimorskyibacter insulae]SPF80549.1 hypothetical protein PRI8871_02359 [Pseudoprimorskyibacter insulae]
MSRETEYKAQGRLTALVVAGVGLFWIAATALGEALDWTQRTRAFFDLAALAGFLLAFWMIYQLWRSRQKDKDER